MSSRIVQILVLAGLGGAVMSASAQSFRVQCPTSTITHPNAASNNAEPSYTGATTLTVGPNGYMIPTGHVNGAIKCQQISGGDGYSTMANGTQTFMFSFGPLSGLADIAKGLPGTEFPSAFNSTYTAGTGILLPGDPATTDAINTGVSPYPYASNTSAGGAAPFSWNGAVGLAPDADAIADGKCTAPCIDGHVDPRQIMDVGVMNGNIPGAVDGDR